MQLLLAVIGSTAITGGVGWWFKTRRDDRIAKDARTQADMDALRARDEKLQAKIESLLMDAIARERENNSQMSERIEMDAKQNEVIVAATATLKECAVLIAKVERTRR